MFLSALISRFEPDGSLVVDLGDAGGPVVRYGAYAAGMPWHRASAGGWVETAFDWGAHLVNRAHEARRDLPVLRYLREWPRDLVEAAEPLWHAQSTVLQLCALHPAVRELLRTNRVMLWLVAARYAEDAAWRVRLPDLLPLPQRELLAAVLDVPQVRPAQVRFLQKIALMDGEESTLRGIRDVVADEGTVMAFSHWRCLPSSLLLAAPGPLLRHLHWLRDCLAAVSNPWVLGQILEGRAELLVDTSRMLEQHAADRVPRVVRFCRDWDGLQRLHDVAVELWGEHAGANLDSATEFGSPPLASDQHFRAITTVGELREEGRAMRHCVATRARDVLAGKCYIYCVDVAGERGTLQVAIAEMAAQGLDTTTAWKFKEKLAWVRKALAPRAARWRITHFLNWAAALVGDTPRLEPVRKALATLKTHIERVVQRWTSTYTNARLDGFNGLFQAARARARGYRNAETFMTMIYLIGSSAGSILKSI